MPDKKAPYYQTHDHRLERAFSAPTPTGESYSTTTTDTAVKMSNINKRDQNGGSNAPLLGHHTPHNERKRGLGNDYVSDATLLTTTSTVGIISETKRSSNHTQKTDESRTQSAQKKPRKKYQRPKTTPRDDRSAVQLAFMVVGALVFVFAVIFGTIHLIIYRMKLLDQQQQ
uniref:Uncharacterized protein n=1 Tax=Lygus hesperus TaxID=30085 RepID=A0A0A9X5I3_LYGHE